MSTFIINLNDTIALSDSAVVELAKVINTCQPCLREVETNCNDVKIVAIICIAIVIVALIARCAVLSWKDAEIKAANAEREAKERAEAAKNGSALGGTTTSKATADNPYPNRKIVSMNPPARPSMPADMDDDDKGTGTKRSNRRRENPYSSPVGFNVTESGKVSNGAANAIFTALPGTGQATGKKYKLHAGTVVPVTLITGLTSDSQSAGATAQVRQDVYDSLTGTHLLIPQGAKVVGTAGAAKGRRMSVTFNRIILPNGASIKLTGSQSADGQGYSGLRDKYDEKWAPTIKGALFAGLFTGLADWIGDIDTKETSGGGLAQSAWGRVAEKVSDRLEDKADAIDKMEQPAVIIRPGYQFHVFLTDDIEIYQYQPLKGEPR